MKKKSVIIVMIVLVATLFGFLAITSPTVKNLETDFNAINAVKHIKEISKQPHSVYDYEAHEEVRQYIINTAKSYVGDENVAQRNYDMAGNKNPKEGITYVSTEYIKNNNLDCEYDIRNVLVTVPGKSETGILLVAHYDSRGHIGRFGELGGSYGAGDDGYGVATLLEIIRYASSQVKNNENTLYVLFADSEEVNMYGSTLEANVNKEVMDKVNFVINVEARGLFGACYMFETSNNNQNVMKFYNKAIDKVSYSVAPAAYSVMTNYTDFMAFTRIGKQGLNFGTLDNINVYHNPSDNYSSVRASSLQHYGSQILPLVKEYLSDVKYQDMNYFVGNQDQVFFNFLPNIFISYSETFGAILSIIILLGVIAYIIFAFKKDWQLFLKQLGVFLGLLVVAIIGGYLVSFVISRFMGTPWTISNVRFNDDKFALLIFMLVMTLGFGLILNKTTKKRESNENFILAAVLFNALLNVLVSFVLSGASFIFMLPALFGLINLVVNKYVNKKLVRDLVTLITIFILVAIYVPLVYSLLLALTIGGLLAFALIAYMPLSILIPQTIKYLNE